MLEQKSVLFSAKNTDIKGFTASLKLSSDAERIFQKARPVPCSLTDSVENEHNRLIQGGIKSRLP